MAMLDEIVSQVGQRFGLHDKAGSLISLLLSLIADPKTGGLGGFLERMKCSGLDSVVTRMMGGEDTTALTNDQVEKGASAASTLNLGVGDPREFRDTPRHKEVSHEQEVYRPAVG